MFCKMLKLNLRRLTMKKIVMASAVMAATAMAGEIDSRPEASVPTPVEARETLDKVPKMSEKENVDWQKMREERRLAREQILKDLRTNSVAEKKELRNELAKPAVAELPPVAEKDAVKIIWAIGIVFGILGIIVALTMPGMLENKTLINFLQIKEMFYHIG
jgi:hypothetical protein